MDEFNAIRAGIFLVGGIMTILFKKQLKNIKNRMLEKLNFKKREEEKGYVYIGIIFIIISIILFVFAITN